MKTIIVIPARYKSTRLPKKPLADIAGEPLIVRTVRNVEKCNLPYLVAYDAYEIGEVLAKYKIPALKTSEKHENGTHRLSEVVEKNNYDDEDLIINVQGDEPLLPAEIINTVAECLKNNPDAAVATLATPFYEEDADNKNAVKVVLSRFNKALYFSRSKIPYPRDGGDFPFLRHIGIYAYRAKTLKLYPSLEPTPLENAEKLEQLRFLEHDLKIAVAIIKNAPPAGVDSEEDRIRVSEIFASNKDFT